MAQTETQTAVQPIKQSGLDFKPFKLAVAAQFEKMKGFPLFRTDVSKDWLKQTYIDSFPAGSNPVYRERTEHECNACFSFIKNVGNVVAIDDAGKLMSIWDGVANDPTVADAYKVVANAMAEMVKANPIVNVFLHTESVAGVDKNFEQLTGIDVQTWQHFFVNIPRQFQVSKDDIGPKLSDTRATHDVMLRSLTELTVDAIETVLDLILQNSLYRGEEHKFAVESFQKLKAEFNQAQNKDLFVWARITSVPGSVSRIRNTSIGKLITDISEGMELEAAVKSFEAMVAPANYKRPSALITPKMIEQAKTKIQELGLMSALERRYARITDITANNILWADRNTKSAMGGDVFDQLAAAIPEKVKNFDKVEEVTIDKFITDILPKATSVELLVENRHAPNFMSLIAPVDPTAGRLFKWDNNFSWTYSGEIADSDLRAAVQARGGSVTGVFRFSHSWNHPGRRNASLMDLHVFMPGSNIGDRATAGAGSHNSGYGNDERIGWNNRTHSKSGGIQDVDYVQAAPENYIPVENITFPDLKRMPEGIYRCKIHNWQQRSPNQAGFQAEIEFEGQIFQYDYPKPLKGGEWIDVVDVELKNGRFSVVKHHLPESGSTRDIWGVQTQNFQKVNLVMFSPNHWDEQGVGNRHYFFILGGAKQEGSARGFYNEFLKSELDPHRKTFEVLGAKMRAPESDDQLSGLGFSSTQRNNVVVRVKGSFTRTIKIVF